MSDPARTPIVEDEETLRVEPDPSNPGRILNVRGLGYRFAE